MTALVSAGSLPDDSPALLAIDPRPAPRAPPSTPSSSRRCSAIGPYGHRTKPRRGCHPGLDRCPHHGPNRCPAAPDAKAILLDASVLGQTFWSSAVAAFSVATRRRRETPRRPRASRLRAAGVPFPRGGRGRVRLWHALVREVAYGELTRGARLAKHRAAAFWITQRAGAALARGRRDRRGPPRPCPRARGRDRGNRRGPCDPGEPRRCASGRRRPCLQDRALRAPALVPQVDGAHGARRSAPRGRPGAARPSFLLATSEYTEAAATLESASAILRADGDPVAAAELGVPTFIALRNAGLTGRATAVINSSRAVLERHPGTPGSSPSLPNRPTST